MESADSIFRGTLKFDHLMDKDDGEYEFISSTSVGNIDDICSIRQTLYKLNHVSKDVTHVPFENGKTKTFECNIQVG